jgi:hypothetical protein
LAKAIVNRTKQAIHQQGAKDYLDREAAQKGQESSNESRKWVFRVQMQ